MLRKGDIILVPFPFTDLSEQKVRPAIILSDANKREDVVVAFISSNKSNRQYFYDIPFKSSHSQFKKTGLKVDSIIKVDKIATLDKKIVLGKLGVIPVDIQTVINNKLKRLFAL
jgi:mRNA interferase MazF